MKDPAIRTKLLEATIESIEKYGIEACTIRNIAAEAGVAFSALHYYFESKEQIVADALTLALGNSFDDLQDLWLHRSDDLAALRAILQYLFDGALRYPGITRASLHSLLMHGTPEGLAHRIFNHMIDLMADDMAKTSHLSRHALSLRLIAALSTVLTMGISPQAFAAGSGLVFTDAASRAQLVETLVEQFSGA